MTGDVIAATVERVLSRVNALGVGGPCLTRPSDSSAESKAHAVIADECAALGLEVTRDAALHLDARLPGCDRSAPPIQVGSRAAPGWLSAAELGERRVDTGRSLAHHMHELGGDPDAVLANQGLPPARPIERHIEQDPVLHEANEPFATVHSARGRLRCRKARIEGIGAHSGGSAREFRADTVFVLADLDTALDRDWVEPSAAGHDRAVGAC
ncbi:hypothetical protein [Aureimonas sp. N4]|uniref:hypothetical protein n=1 Tax=Aureimonas sp. N4 TaxID=1638165 RepID=UPI000784C996|nr:hypothetical protein [Aureimonas sp. N4]